MQQWVQGTGQGWASTFTRRQQPRQQPCNATASHGGSPPSPRGYVWSTGCEDGWAHMPFWGPWVLTPGCLKQRGSKATTHAGLPLEWQAPGCLGPQPWLFGAARSQGRAHVDNLRGSWAPSLAVCKSSGEQGRSTPQDSTGRRKLQRYHTRDRRHGKGCVQCTTPAGSQSPSGNLHPAGAMHQ